MAAPLLKTKLYIPPVQMELVSRSRLLERLDAGSRVGHSLTLVSAPAGFGKSTLLSEYAAHCQHAIAWLSLDSDDNDVARFWTYVIRALQVVCRDVGKDVLELLQPAQLPPFESLLTPLINDLTALSGRLVLVIDDYHEISTAAIHRGMTFLLDHQPPQLHLMISTRADPPLPIARLRARRRLTELRANDLRFTCEEAAAFLNQVMRLDLDARDVLALEARTEGWIVGLQLAALAMTSSAGTQERSDAHTFIEAFTGSHHYVLEYLTEEVVHQQPTTVQQFLLQTSVLERLCGSLCDAVLLNSIVPDGNATLADLRRRNLFLVPLDDERLWYRYHHLFADLLRNLLRRESTPEQIQALHCRASEWYEQNGESEAAIRHALQARDFERVASLIERTFTAALSRGNVNTLLHWIEALPENVVRKRPRLCMYQGWSMFLNGQYAQCERTLQHAKSALQEVPASIGKDVLRGELGAMLATIATIHQDVPGAIQEAQIALSSLPDDRLSSRARATRALGIAYGLSGDTKRLIEVCRQAKSLAIAGENMFLAAEVISQSAFAQVHHGCLRQAARSYQEIVDLVQHSSGFPPAGLGYIGLAVVALEWNDLEAAQDFLNRGTELCQRGGIGYSLRTAYCTQAVLRQAVGDTPGALDALDKATRLHRVGGSLDIAVQLVQYHVRLLISLGDVEAAYRWANGEGLTPHVSLGNLPPVLHEVHQVALARVHLARNEPDRVLAIYDRLCPLAQAGGRMARVIEITLLKALALYAQHEADAALESLERCLALAEPERYVRLFLEAGAGIAELLQLALKRGIKTDYAHTLLAALSPIKTEPLRPVPCPSIEPLTRRERQVLRLIGTGLSNREIADELFVSLNTVKKHSSNIYGKLGVTSRTQAVARAQELGLL